MPSPHCTCHRLRSLTELCDRCEYALANCCSECGEDVAGHFVFEDGDKRLCLDCHEDLKETIAAKVSEK